MTKTYFTDNFTINVIARDGEKFILKAYFQVPQKEQNKIAKSLSHYFEVYYSNDKSRMVYDVFLKMTWDEGFTFHTQGGDRSEERKRIGSKIRQLRKEKGMEAKQLAALTNINAANLSRIERGKYSVGFDILTRIADALGVKVDLV